MFAMIQAAGWPAGFLLAASVVAIALIVERLLYLRTARILPPALLDEAIAVSRAGAVNDEVIAQLEQHSPLGRILAAGMRHLAGPRETMQQSIEAAGRAVAHRLERYLTTLGTVVTLAPMLGLFGTVVGMIELFGAQDVAGVDPLRVAHGLSVALYNTAFGLAIAIPALLFHRHFHARVDSFMIDLEQQAARFVACAGARQD